MIRFLVLLVVGNLLWCQQLSAQKQISTDVLVGNLKNPSGVAIRPVTQEVYISDTGRGRVIQASKNSVREIITDFPVEDFELDQSLTLGPMALMFRKRNLLIVGTGGEPDGEDAISVYDVEDADQTSKTAAEFEYQLKMPAKDGQPAEGDFMCLAKTKYSLFFSCNGDSDKGWVTKADLIVNDFREPRRFIATNEIAQTPTPGGITVSPDGHIVVAQMGKRDLPNDSVLTFYSEGGELLDKFPTGLSDIVALAYSPRKKQLFALDYNWAEPKKGGLYKLVAVDTKEGCEAKLVTSLERPTSMAFGKNGELYVTVCGFPDEDSEDDDEYLSPGKCLLIKGFE